MYSEFKNELEQVIYASISSNRNENNISCSGPNLLYSRCRKPIIYDVNSKQILELDTEKSNGHKDDINGQCFIDGSNEDTLYLISTSHDKTAKIWQLNADKKSQILHTLESREGEVFISRSCFRHNQKFFTITTTIEGNIHLWNDSDLAQTITAKYCCFYSKTKAIEFAGQKFIFVFLAGSDNQIHIYQVDLIESKLIHLLDLQGHTDWIKCIDVLSLEDGRQLEFLLASASQDTFVRVWLMRIDSSTVDPSKIRTIASNKLSNITTEVRLTATLETVLSGHEGIVHGLSWFKSVEGGKYRLATCSADKTIVVWESDIVSPSSLDNQQSYLTGRYEYNPATQGKWVQLAKLGETGETNLPFLGVCLSHDNRTLFAQSLRGAIHAWTITADNLVLPAYSITGHFEPVTDISWEQAGRYMLTSSLDKTCRLHAVAIENKRWSEIARPQVHGHEVNCVASIDPFRFATGSEEKVVRVFGATKFFIKNHEILAQEKLDFHSEIPDAELPPHAQLPALGLSIRGSKSPYDIESNEEETNPPNKSKKKLDNNNEWHEVSRLVKEMSKVDHLDALPVEEILLQSTLWWERNKLFGHGNELHTLTVDNKREFLASASRANRDDLANVIVWDCEKFRKVSTIAHHSLTITRLRFSPDSRYLLSVSRDRTWCLSRRNTTGQLRNAYKKYFGSSKHDVGHDRIIWDCSWTYDSKYFMTVSRDKKAILWSVEEIERVVDCDKSGDSTLRDGQDGKLNIYSSKTFDSSIQAVDSRAISGQAGYLYALGFDNGSLELLIVNPTITANDRDDRCIWNTIRRIDNYHQLSIRRIAFKPDVESSEPRSIIVASGGDDCIVKLTRFSF